ncbi:hypothetical protein [Tunicatimonas pelagia]|uniref:hypothetical protein n=1 Tax=Tunicatimonas pelagia TaxID=931531 RepID=UPI0026666472|nr:hypothetical protein [Tunicatimonas pelagia]WKN44916.1 hypothetical protein P0M28_08065 [Tunicatimonas pelagia]
MKCTHCKRPLKYDWKFCPDCGQPIHEIAATLIEQNDEDYAEDRDDYPMDFDPVRYDL